MKKQVMKIILTSLLFFILSAVALADDLGGESQRLVRDFIATVKAGNREKIAFIVSYPLSREYPIPEVKTKRELLSRFDQIFDDYLLSKIVKSNIKKDWSEMGSRGIMLLNGLVWLDSDGKLIAVNYLSRKEKLVKERLIAAERSTLYKPLRKFQTPVCKLETSSYRIRIDDMGNGAYRYASWKKQQGMNEKPAVIILNGEIQVLGTGGNLSYIFKLGEYTYECGIDKLGEEGAAPAHLSVLKGDAEILYQDAEIK